MWVGCRWSPHGRASRNKAFIWPLLAIPSPHTHTPRPGPPYQGLERDLSPLKSADSCKVENFPVSLKHIRPFLRTKTVCMKKVSVIQVFPGWLSLFPSCPSWGGNTYPGFLFLSRGLHPGNNEQSLLIASSNKVRTSCPQILCCVGSSAGLSLQFQEDGISTCRLCLPQMET